MNPGRRVEVPNAELVRIYLAQERDWMIHKRLTLLNLILELPESATLADICRGLNIPLSTAYVWLRAWRKHGYAGLCHPLETGKGLPGRRAALSEDDLITLRQLLEQQPAWTTAQVRELIKQHWNIEYSPSQVSRILRNKLKMHFGKPYPHDFRRPPDAEAQLEAVLIQVYSDLIDQGVDEKEIALGFLDEASPQLTANTVRVWHFGKGEVTKDTTKRKANTIGFYAIAGHSVQDFLENSKATSIVEFLPKIRAANTEYGVIVVVLDNFSSHHAAILQQASEDNDILLVYLPSYSPDLNPIEFIWKSVKRAISVRFVHSTDEMRQVITAAWSEAAQHCSFGKGWIQRFVGSVIDYKPICA
jgi:putative transposase